MKPETRKMVFITIMFYILAVITALWLVID